VSRLLGLVITISLANISCWPVIANLAEGKTVPKDLDRYVPHDSRILVFPLWVDGEVYDFRDPYIITASAIGTPEARVLRRMGFYIDMYACGGPSKFVWGYLLMPDRGSVVWSDPIGVRRSDDRNAFVGELKTMMSAGGVGPRIRGLIQYGDVRMKVHINEDEGEAALAFLDAMSAP